MSVIIVNDKVRLAKINSIEVLHRCSFFIWHSLLSFFLCVLGSGVPFSVSCYLFVFGCLEIITDLGACTSLGSLLRLTSDLKGHILGSE